MRWVRVAGYGMLAALAVVAAAAVAERLIWDERVLPGVRLPGVAVGGDSFTDARRDIAAHAASLEDETFEAVAGGERFTFTAAEVGTDVDEEEAAAAAEAAGRNGNLLTQAFGAVLRRFRPDEVHLEVRYDGSRLEAEVDAWAERIDRPPRDGQVRVDGASVVTVAPVEGRALVADGTVRVVQRALARGAEGPLRLPVETTPPRITSAEVERTAAEARSIVAAPATVTVEGRVATLS
ncbi:MAG: peptidoglycan binding domain-containing protein, partial [Acidimicrobiia bacterium]